MENSSRAQSRINTDTLQTSIDLINHGTARVSSPIPAILETGRRNWKIFDVVGAFQEVGVESCGYVPRDVTVHRPYARVVRRPLNNQVSACRQDMGVTPLRVARVDDATVPGAGACRECLPTSDLSEDIA